MNELVQKWKYLNKVYLVENKFVKTCLQVELQRWDRDSFDAQEKLSRNFVFGFLVSRRSMQSKISDRAELALSGMLWSVNENEAASLSC